MIKKVWVMVSILLEVATNVIAQNSNCQFDVQHAETLSGFSAQQKNGLV